MSKANFLNHIFAFFDPNTAVNEEGYLVNANGFFDSGSGSTDYLSPSNLSPIEDFLYGDFTGNFVGFSPSTYQAGVGGSDQLGDLDSFFNSMQDSIDDYNNAAISSADKAMEFSVNEAQKVRDWQETMYERSLADQTNLSNTAYQRAMQDMKKAGLNPKLVAKLGGASVPSGTIPSSPMGSSSIPSLKSSDFGALASVLSTYITGADALDRNQNDFVKSIITALIAFAS